MLVVYGIYDEDSTTVDTSKSNNTKYYISFIYMKLYSYEYMHVLIIMIRAVIIKTSVKTEKAIHIPYVCIYFIIIIIKGALH